MLITLIRERYKALITSALRCGRPELAAHLVLRGSREIRRSA